MKYKFRMKWNKQKYFNTWKTIWSLVMLIIVLCTTYAYVGRKEVFLPESIIAFGMLMCILGMVIGTFTSEFYKQLREQLGLVKEK